jgi:hypothetical protein
MNLKIIPTESFKKEVKHLKKKYPRITLSLKELDRSLQQGNFGVPLGKGVFKKRVKNIDIPKGKSKGFRVIGYKDIDMEKFYLLTIYSKSDKETIRDQEIIELLKETVVPGISS